MRKAFQVLFIAVIMTLTLRAESVSAVTCVALEYQLPRLDTVVEGRITDIPAKGRVRLEVTTYYKGEGGPVLDAEVVALGDGQRMDWMRVPRRGDRVLIGFVKQDQNLRNEMCNLLTILQPNEELPAQVRDLLGDGHPPEGEVDHPTGRIPVWEVLSGLVVVAGASTWLFMRKRHAHNTGG